MTRQPEQILPDHSVRLSRRIGSLPPSRRRPAPRMPRPGAVDGAWWPHTDDLAAELAALDFEALQRGRARPVDRIMYNIGDWRPAPKRMALGGRSIHLDGYRHLSAHTLCVLGLDRTRLVLLVIPPCTEAATARLLLSAASRPGNERTAHELLAAADRQSREYAQNADALRRWDDEGGRTPLPAGRAPSPAGPRAGPERSI
ncbi:DUF5994 family protein [Nocardia sp. NPDC024068]|uniref:DUF5994 family protein n=1 Tax=Nocardia sp. NPDC024068 TaxID=3157197 RepID=UPI0033C07A76